MIDWNAEAAHFGAHWARLAEPARHAIAGALDLRGARALDVGCGNGDFCALALARGADVSGIDAAGGMIAIARERAPGADLRVGGMDALPYDDGAFDAVTGFNSLQFSDDPPASLREWMRVTRPGGSIAICAWAERERCEVDVVEAELRALGRAQASEPLGPRLEAVAREAGLTLTASDAVAVPYEVADQDELELAFLLDARAYGAIETAGEKGSRAAITAAAAPFRGGDGSYRFENLKLARPWSLIPLRREQVTTVSCRGARHLAPQRAQSDEERAVLACANRVRGPRAEPALAQDTRPRVADQRHRELLGRAPERLSAPPPTPGCARNDSYATSSTSGPCARTSRSSTPNSTAGRQPGLRPDQLPGVKVLRAAAFAAHSLPIERFPTPSTCPRRPAWRPASYQSASVHRRTAISCTGLPEHRDALMGIAWGLGLTRPRSNERRHKLNHRGLTGIQARVALAVTPAGLCWRLLLPNSPTTISVTIAPGETADGDGDAAMPH